MGRSDSIPTEQEVLDAVKENMIITGDAVKEEAQKLGIDLPGGEGEKNRRKPKKCKHGKYKFPDPNNKAIVQCVDCGITATVNVNFNPNFSTSHGRNSPCYCGSGKKYKKCCGRV